MLARILAWSLANRLVVILAWTGIAILGGIAALRLPLDAFPDTTPVQVQVSTVAPQLSPLEIERQITRPVEAALAGLPGLTELRSVSKFGFAHVTLLFEDGTDVYFARQVAMERLQGVDLPDAVGRPRLGPVATGLGEIFHYVVSGAGASLAELRTVQDWTIAPELRSVPGVAEVNAWGGDERQAHVLVDPVRLLQFGLSLEDLARAVEANNANVGGGTLEQAGESSLIHGVGVATGLDDVAEMVVATREGVPVRVRDVARVAPGREIRRGAVTADGGGEVVLGLAFVLSGENSRDVASRLRLRLEEVRKRLPPGIDAEVVYDRTVLVDRVLRTVRRNLFEGALLVIAVLFAFLGNLRAGLIVAAAIPLSLLFGANLMMRFGVAGSLMSLGALDFGLLVDSSVIQVENVLRRLAHDTSGRSRLEVVERAVLEVRQPTLFGELIIAAVYLPILTLEGVEGRLFRPMAATVLFALAGAMLMSLTLTPALASLVLPRRPSARATWAMVRLVQVYRPVLGAALRRPRLVLAATLLAVLSAAGLATRLGSEFVPRLQEGSIVANTVRLAGVSLDESVRYGTQIERALLAAFPDEIDRLWSRTGSAEIATDPMGIELTDVFVMLRPVEGWTRARDQEELVGAMSATLAGLPGMRTIFTQPIEMRVNEMLAGIRSDLGVKLYGDDFEALKAGAARIQAVLESIPGAADVVVEPITGQPVLEIVVDRAAIARHGIAARDVLGAVEALGTRKVGTIQDGETRYPIALRLEDRYRVDAAAIESILVGAAGGDRVPLGTLAEVQSVTSPSTISREWGRRRIVVQCNVRGRDVGSFVAAARQAIARDVTLPPGSFVRYGGQFENYERGRDRLRLVIPAALGLVFVLLYLTYRRVLDALRVFTGVPLAAVGGILALWLRDMPFSISAGVGFVALSGVAVLGDMVLVSAIRQRLADGLPLLAAIEAAAESRLRPVLMTGLVASLGFVPMAFQSGFGAEVQRPLATVVVGGVATSTLLTLVVLPVLYAVMSRREAAEPAPAD